MPIKLSNWKVKGMQRDMSVSAFNSDYAYSINNMRVTALDGETTLSLVNEKGPLKVSILNIGDSLAGFPIGTIPIGKYLIVFTTGDKDRIYRLHFSTTILSGILLYEGHLNFNEKHPIEAIASIESDFINKIYWVDGINLPRVINVTKELLIDYNPNLSYQLNCKYTDSSFDFVLELLLKENVKVEKIALSNGLFPAGVIQYAFTYYNKYGQESNIFYTTPLQYTSFYDRGAAADKTVSNCFNITIDNLDSRFDYVRIYSIMRTSLESTPIVKRVVDLNVTGSTISYIDTGTNGSNVDATLLLYIGGEDIIAYTLQLKDNTLFLGNIFLNRPSIPKGIKNSLKLELSDKFKTVRLELTITPVSTGVYEYSSTLNTYGAGFKNREYYRCGVQFQYKNGKWSEPIWLGDYKVDSIGPAISYNKLYKLCILNTLSYKHILEIHKLGYLKMRPLIVFPTILDRTILCQGVIAPTVYTDRHRNSDKDLYAQSSWFFRPFSYNKNDLSKTVRQPKSIHGQPLEYASKDLNYNPSNLRSVEIQGHYNDENKFKVDWSLLTLHSPDVELDDTFLLVNLSTMKVRNVGTVSIERTLSDIDIQTATPPISGSGSGFIHRSFVDESAKGIISGLFYDDYSVDEKVKDGVTLRLQQYSKLKNPVKWMVYTWHKSGSLNNDINRPSDLGTRSAELKRKVISNLRCGTTAWNSTILDIPLLSLPLVFSDDLLAILKLEDKVYLGNVDSMLVPDAADGHYFAHNSTNITSESSLISFENDILWKTFSTNENDAKLTGLYRFYGSKWQYDNWNLGDGFIALAIHKDSVRLKYKSSPHLVLNTLMPILDCSSALIPYALPVVEVYRPYNQNTMFGGVSDDALLANVWLPAGEPININKDSLLYDLKYVYGDTWYNRYDCLKTYNYTSEDLNQVVEIGSFQLETHVNIDARYDKNRGLVNNTYVSPINFNLLNPIYNLKDNYFNYSILDQDYYNINSYPNTLTWSLTKLAGSIVDTWTNITMANTLDLDGDKGKLNSILRYNDSLIAFQDKGISLILYNENVLIASTEGVPIEIANSNKVLGNRYISDIVGCSNKWGIVTTSRGIYFPDENTRDLYLFSGQLNNLSLTKGFSSYLYNRVGDGLIWNPREFINIVSYYDSTSEDVYFITEDECLCFNEGIQEFSSFYSYNGNPYFANTNNRGLWIKPNKANNTDIWVHHEGQYNNFFGIYQPFGLTIVANPDTFIDKVFDNVEFCSDTWNGDTLLEDTFDVLDCYNEYQFSSIWLKNLLNRPSSLKKKFRVWRANIGRAIYGDLITLPERNGEMDLPELEEEIDLNLNLKLKTTQDRIRNTWAYVGLYKTTENYNKTILHNLSVKYFI